MGNEWDRISRSAGLPVSVKCREVKVPPEDWCYPEGPGIVKSYEFPLSSGTYGSNGGSKLTNHIRASVGLPTEWEPINKIQIIAEVHDLKRKLANAEMKLAKLETIKIVEFKNNDVYEANKRIERLEAKVALINSNLANNRVVRFCLRFFNS